MTEVFRFIDAEKACFPIAFMCQRLGVSTAGYYAWRTRPPSARAVADARLSTTIRLIHAGSRGTYGAPRVHAELAHDHDVHCGRKRVARLRRMAGLRGVCRRRHVRTTRRDELAQLSDDLIHRQFSASEPNRLWVADIERHEAPCNRAEMKGLRRWAVAAVKRSWGQSGRARRRGQTDAAPTTPRPVGTARRPGLGKRSRTVYVRNQRPNAPQEKTTSSNLADGGWVAVHARGGGRLGGRVMSPALRPR